MKLLAGVLLLIVIVVVVNALLETNGNSGLTATQKLKNKGMTIIPGALALNPKRSSGNQVIA